MDNLQEIMAINETNAIPDREIDLSAVLKYLFDTMLANMLTYKDVQKSYIL